MAVITEAERAELYRERDRTERQRRLQGALPYCAVCGEEGFVTVARDAGLRFDHVLSWTHASGSVHHETLEGHDVDLRAVREKMTAARRSLENRDKSATEIFIESLTVQGS